MTRFPTTDDGMWPIQRMRDWTDPADAPTGTCARCGEPNVELDNEELCESCAERWAAEKRTDSTGMFDDIPLEKEPKLPLGSPLFDYVPKPPRKEGAE